MGNRSRQSIRNRAILIGAIFLLVLAGLFFLLQEEEKPITYTGQGSEGFGQLKRITVDGKNYKEIPAVTTILLYGVDQENIKAERRRVDYRHGGQADFQLLLAIDHTHGVIHQLQIDRDTMTEIQILGVFGNEVGTRVQQICLAHAFGATQEDNAKYAVWAVENLLGGEEIDGYYGIDYSTIPVLNDLLGGVQVTIPDNMTAVDPTWTAGTTVLLKGKQAEGFLRSRMSVGNGRNSERSARQRIYMKSAIGNLKKLLSQDLSFGLTLMNNLEPLAVTNMTTARLINEMNRAAKYEVRDPESLPGEYRLGRDGFVEFHAKENSAIQWVIDHLYTIDP